MKIRLSYVSNSSACSFLVGKNISNIIPCIKLSEEIWKSIEKNYRDFKGNKINLSSISNEWYLTEFIYDSADKFKTISDMKESVEYISGDECPYDYYGNGETNYTVLKKEGNSFFINNYDLYEKEPEDIPDILKLRNKLNLIMNDKKLNKSQKLNLIKAFINF